MPDDRTETTARRARPAEFASLAARSLSVLALVVSAWQTEPMQAQARTGVWPCVSSGTSHYDAGERHGFAWQVSNHGAEPAKIEAVGLLLDRKPARNRGEAIRNVPGYPREGLSGAAFGDVHGVALPPDASRVPPSRRSA